MTYKLVRTVNAVPKYCPKFDTHVFWAQLSRKGKLIARVKYINRARAYDLSWNALLGIDTRPPRSAL